MIQKFILLVSFTLILMADSPIIQINSKCSVKVTVDKLEYALNKNGATIFARINHSQNAKDVNLTLSDSEVLIFGNPSIGTKIMQRDILSGLDLPFKILVYKNKKLQTKIAYHKPEILKDKYKLKECKVINKLNDFLQNIITEVTTTSCGRK